MTDGEKDRFGDSLRQLGKSRENQWATELENEILANLKRHAKQRLELERQHGNVPKIFKKILCPLDFAPSSIRSLELAGRLASQNKADLHILHVCSAIFVPLSGSVTDRVMSEQLAKHIMEESAKQLPQDVRCRVFVETGDPANKVLAIQAASDVDLIVMGTHGRKAVSHFFMGSVAERVVRAATCPVLTIR
jgi:nucleotide-binding universal stress UspA family protein